jgi:hypothetical protein
MADTLTHSHLECIAIGVREGIGDRFVCVMPQSEVTGSGQAVSAGRCPRRVR